MKSPAVHLTTVLFDASFASYLVTSGSETKKDADRQKASRADISLPRLEEPLAARESDGLCFIRAESRRRDALPGPARRKARLLHRCGRTGSGRRFGHQGILRSWLAWHKH